MAHSFVLAEDALLIAASDGAGNGIKLMYPKEMEHFLLLGSAQIAEGAKELITGWLMGLELGISDSPASHCQQLSRHEELLSDNTRHHTVGQGEDTIWCFTFCK